jgi:transposase
LNKRKHHKHVIRTIIRIPDNLWNEIKDILPDEKPENTIGHPIVPYRKVLDGIIFVLRTGCQWKMLPKEYVLVQHVIEDFRNGCN